jgi:hypothetical protein
MPTSRPLAAAALLACAAALLTAAPARADGDQLEPLMDNSFLLEEAYNQEPGVVQNIFTFQRDRASKSWVGTYTNEWPAPGMTHQLSYTLVLAKDGAPGGATAFSDVYLNYRWQAVAAEGEGKVAVSPRLSAIVPTGGKDTGTGYRGFGVQAGLPISVELAPWLVSHVNLGITWVPSGKVGDQTAEHLSVSGGQSLIWLVTPRFNLLTEVVWSSNDVKAGGATDRSQQLTVSPGLRYGVDLGETQVVLGVAVPMGVGPSAGDRAIFGYLSVELPYWHPAEEKAEGKK